MRVRSTEPLSVKLDVHREEVKQQLEQISEASYEDDIDRSIGNEKESSMNVPKSKDETGN
mgnify:CR=1 FL=1